MPAVQPADTSTVPVVPEVTGAPRSVATVVTAQHTLEGGGFPVRRPFPGIDASITDPFLLLDHMGPIDYAPGAAKGAPDHPHRGFETVTYLLDGAMEHRDSRGGGGVIRGGDTQWMTAGAGLVHSEMPTPELLRDGGVLHGVQLWVNLPRRDKGATPRYQDLTGDRLTLLRTADGKGLVRLIAGELAGVRGPGSTHTPIVYAHATLEPGGHLALDWPSEFNALAYVLAGGGRFGADATTAVEGQLAVFDRGESVVVDADTTLDVLLLGGQPIREPIVWYGPFVMNTKQEILDTFDLYERGELGSIPTREG
jgi:redox-sensitive bicupin YhaK (pirin superfamily)